MTSFDYAVIAIIVLSALVGWWRGFMYELFSLIGWLAAYIVAHTFSAKLMPLYATGGRHGKHPFGNGFAVLFIATLIVGALFAWFLARLAKFAGLSGMDGKFGAIFGMLRGGMVVIALVWWRVDRSAEGPFWRNALSSKPLQEAALYAKDYLPEHAARK